MKRWSEPIYQVLVRLPLGWMPAWLRLQIRALAYEMSAEAEPEYGVLSAIGPNCGCAIDAGANVGLYSLRLSRLYERVHAFEPHPVVFRELSLAKIPRVDARNVALSNETGTARLHVPLQFGKELFGWSSMQPSAAGSGQETTVEVSTARLDDLRLDRITFMKIDVEGHELELLKGAMETIRSNLPVIMCEAKGPNADKISSLLSPLGYGRLDLHELLGIRGSRDCWIFAIGKGRH